MTERALAIVVLAALLGGPFPADAEYVRDEIRINLRTGPGPDFPVIRSLRSGEAVTRLARENSWEQVRTDAGEEGWLPAGYLTSDQPASLLVPELEAKLRAAEARLEQLDAELATRAETPDAGLKALRAQMEALEADNLRLAGASFWRMLATGAAIVLLGMLIGVLIPRRDSARNRRIKL